MEIGDIYGYVEHEGRNYKKWKPSWPGECFAYTEIDSKGNEVLVDSGFNGVKITKTFYTLYPIEVRAEAIGGYSHAY